MTESEATKEGFCDGTNAVELGIADNFERKVFEMLVSKETPFNTQVGGTHYKSMAIQPVEFATANKLDFFQKDILKYILRKKENRIQDLRKAKHYIEMYIAVLEENPNWPQEESK